MFLISAVVHGACLKQPELIWRNSFEWDSWNRIFVIGSEGLEKWTAAIWNALPLLSLHRGIYGENHWVLHTQQLQEKGNQVDRARATREGDTVRLATKEVGLTVAANADKEIAEECMRTGGAVNG
jgi:hypothetical protein